MPRWKTHPPGLARPPDVRTECAKKRAGAPVCAHPFGGAGLASGGPVVHRPAPLTPRHPTARAQSGRPRRHGTARTPCRASRRGLPAVALRSPTARDATVTRPRGPARPPGGAGPAPPPRRGRRPRRYGSAVADGTGRHGHPAPRPCAARRRHGRAPRSLPGGTGRRAQPVGAGPAPVPPAAQSQPCGPARRRALHGIPDTAGLRSLPGGRGRHGHPAAPLGAASPAA